MEYPYYTPIILTDSIFTDYGGDTTKGTSTQRKIAYRIAEMQATEDLSTFLLPTIYTGMYPFNTRIILDHAFVNSISVIRFIDTKEDIYYTITGTANVYASIQNADRGVLDIHYWLGSCNCHSSINPYPYQVQVVYNAGLPSGTTYQADTLLALETYADIILNEIVGYGNEAPGDVRVDSFNNQQYSERRLLKNTSFGGSPRANFASRLLQRLRLNRYVGI